MDLIEGRFIAAHKYLGTLARVATIEDWREASSRALGQQIQGPETFALLHPQYFAEDPVLTVRLQGSRQFKPAELAAVEGHGCQSKRIWGYACDLSSGSSLNADHVFPYALGGPTISSNLLPLCRYHNQVKTHDIHLYPHWQAAPSWVWQGLRQRLEALAR